MDARRAGLSGVRDPIGLRHALRGLRMAVRSERNLRLHLLAAVTALGVTWWLDAAWLPVIVVIGLVISLELVNTAIEAAVDRCTGQQHDPLAQRAKDTAAAAVLVAAGVAVVVALLNWGPPLLDRLKLGSL
jgi:diacylglycerol kinase